MTKSERLAAAALALSAVAVLLSALALAVAATQRNKWADLYLELQHRTAVETGRWIDVQ